MTDTSNFARRPRGGAAVLDQILGAVKAIEPYENVLMEALHSLQEARFLLLDMRFLSPMKRDQKRFKEAMAVLDQGIAQARDALNLTDPLEKL